MDLDLLPKCSCTPPHELVYQEKRSTLSKRKKNQALVTLSDILCSRRGWTTWSWRSLANIAAVARWALESAPKSPMFLHLDEF